MKKLVLTLFAAVVVTMSSFAQGRPSIGLEVALPMGDFGDAFGTGIGATVRYEGGINDNLNWMGTIGYIAFAEKDDSGVTASAIPLQAGLKYYFTESFGGFYAGAELGLHFMKAKFDSDLYDIDSESETEFGFAPQIGYQVGNVDIGARYQIVSDADYFGIRIAYVFGGNN